MSTLKDLVAICLVSATLLLLPREILDYKDTWGISATLIMWMGIVEVQCFGPKESRHYSRFFSVQVTSFHFRVINLDLDLNQINKKRATVIASVTCANDNKWKVS